MKFQLFHFDTLDSTNREASDQARRGAAAGVTVVADEQTAGRGRQGRSWNSNKGAGAYFSTILRPRLDPKYYTLIPLVAAVAVYDALKHGWLIEPDIKWPNDILVKEKKICGILAEMIDTPIGHAIILGIGINIRDADPEMNATSIDAESASPARRDDVVTAVHEQLAMYYDRLLADPVSIISEWSRRSSFSSGKEVKVDIGNGESYAGITCGIEENGALRVQAADGSVRIVQAGDVTRLRKL